MKTLYLECYSGISGDMTVAALLDLGADKDALLAGLNSLGVDGYTVKIGSAEKCGIVACDFDVVLYDCHGHDHSNDDHSNEHGHAHDIAHKHCCHSEHSHEHNHDSEHQHRHQCGNHNHNHDDHSHSEHSHEHNHDSERQHYHQCGNHNHNHSHDHSHNHADHHTHRGINEINALIDNSAISDTAKTLAKKIFMVVAKAEAKVHGKAVDEVHFHEVGAVDSIVDIVGAAICIDNLGITRVVATPLREGQGTVKCQHGRVPVPAPATLEIASAHRIPLVITNNQGEMVTPTGAAIIAALADSFEPIGEVRLLKVGYGAGKKDFAVANVLRASIIEQTSQTDSQHQDIVLEIAANIDDMPAEQLSYACELLLQNGALDCWLTPIVMKKSRLANTLSVLINPTDEAAITDLILRHTSTIGVRITPHRRTKMLREIKTVATKYGDCLIKEMSYKDICKISVEYESAKKLATSANIPISEVYNDIIIHQK